MICMLSIFGILGHGPIILAASPLTIGNNDLLMLTLHLLSFTDSFNLWAVHCQCPNNQLVSFYPILFWFFQSREGLAYIWTLNN